MSGHILIVESIAINRISLQSTLEAAHYEVTLCENVTDAVRLADEINPDLIIVDTVVDAAAARLFIAGCLTMPRVSAPPVIALVAPDKPRARLAALRAGAVDAIDKPVPEALLKARIRSLLRNRATLAELQPAAQAAVPHCFAEPEVAFSRGSTIAVLTPQPDNVPKALRNLMSERKGHFELHPSFSKFVTSRRIAPPDLIVIDASLSGEGGDSRGPFAPGEVFRMLADLRSRVEYRYCAQIVLLPENAVDLATLSLDLGADDIATTLVGTAELSHRIDGLIEQKARQDHMRAMIQIELQAAMTDSLTGLHNRRYALPEIKAMAEDAASNSSQFAVMILDIDLFKEVNDTWGHAVGDRVLIAVAQRLREALRPSDLLARIGGEEFLVAMPNATLDKAQAMAERLRQTVERARVDCGPTTQTSARGGISVTLSVGVAMGDSAARTDNGIDALFSRADRALYEAKESGRNNVTLAHTAA